MQREEGREEVVQQGFDHHVLNSGEMKNEIDAVRLLHASFRLQIFTIKILFIKTGNSLVMEKDDNVYQEEDEVELEHYEEVVEQQEYGDEEQVEYVSTEDYVNQTTNDVEEEMTDAQRQFIEAQQDLHFIEE
uniref:Gag-pol polyprotein n=1 Tax=Heterorhabditis bacteriophora TaxID=37862 RepID=A0A1I7XHA9_HETBA